MKGLFIKLGFAVIFLLFSSYFAQAQNWYNNLDDSISAVYWINTQTAESKGALSEKVYAFTDSLFPYGLGVENEFPDNIKGKNAMVYFSGRAKYFGDTSRGIYVFSVIDHKNIVYWKGVLLSKYKAGSGDWFRFSDSAFIPANMTKEAKIKAYLWNNHPQKPVDIDNLDFRFVIIKHPTFLPEVPETTVEDTSPLFYKILYQNHFYRIVYAASDSMLNIESHTGIPLINDVLYYFYRTHNNRQIKHYERWYFVKIKQKKDIKILVLKTKDQLSKVFLEIACSDNSPQINFVLHEKYKKSQFIHRNTLILKSKQAISEVFRSNRRSDTGNFQDEYWLDKEGVKFGKGKNSWIVYRPSAVSSLQLDGKNNILFVNLDYEKDHPFFRFPLMPDSINWRKDESFSRFKHGQVQTSSFSITVGTGTRQLPRLMKNPNGFQATYIWTEHADYSDIRTNRATYFGNEHIHNPDSATGGFVKYNIPVTKSVFYDNLDSINNFTDSGGEFKGLECSIMNDTAFHSFLNKIKPLGMDICLHTPEQFTTTRKRLEIALRFMQKNFGSPTWIDHGDNNGLQNNREDLICDGTLKNSPYYALDLWKKYGVKYLHDAYYENMNNFKGWQFSSSIEKPYRGFGDFFPKPDYWQHPTRTGSIFHWPTTKVLYVKNNSMWNYFFNSAQFSQFINAWGVEINHCYPARVNRKKAFWTKDVNGNIVAAPGFNRTLKKMAELRDKGLLNVCTVSDFLNYRLSTDKLHYQILADGRVKVTNLSGSNIKGLSFAAKAKAVLVDGLRPEQKKDNEDIIFWFDLKAGESRLIRCVE